MAILGVGSSTLKSKDAMLDRLDQAQGSTATNWVMYVMRSFNRLMSVADFSSYWGEEDIDLPISFHPQVIFIKFQVNLLGSLEKKKSMRRMCMRG